METDRLVHWLLNGLKLDTSIFHVGKYCGRWQASTAGRGCGSFHLILHGNCYLHIPGQPALLLGPRDSVFLLRDVPHFLSPELHPDPAMMPAMTSMQRLENVRSGDTGLACGFFHFHGTAGELMLNAFPTHLVIRADDQQLRAAATLFELILDEPGTHPDTPSPLIARLAEVLFFYVIRHVAHLQDVASGLLAVAQRPEFAPLLEHLLRAPGEDWSIASMARLAHMSRASFYKHFVASCGQPPAQFLLALRMQIAAQRLDAGATIDQTAEHVGYRSYAAFSRAFKKVIGLQPGAYRRASSGNSNGRIVSAVQ
ncbi:AraC-like DNA-binding protein [Herbaspirillum sp. Sphag1AN]|uniref:AraC family transcriptional regulator n=1 Tax=unclassified Herbaspirillum TaxID=2624150 RepID=UPI00160CF353|nr:MULTISPECIES: AraC family transcriptional regulator [unclassified Herbaspirillum]MBB3211864.1 AraC-like DNA-binding protein [Herbaspirillum sp. Sphag1AN]MBB3244302.1 AraC-like DNA-binding protein [Herbaspirillum sp. Sphag64]